MNAPASVYVVEDDLGVVACYFADSIRPESGFFLVGAAVGGEGGLAETIAEASVDILITDCGLPEADGLKLIMQTKEIRPAIRTVLMTGTPFARHHRPSTSRRGRRGSVQALQRR